MELELFQDYEGFLLINIYIYIDIYIYIYIYAPHWKYQ